MAARYRVGPHSDLTVQCRASETATLRNIEERHAARPVLISSRAFRNTADTIQEQQATIAELKSAMQQLAPLANEQALEAQRVKNKCISTALLES